MVNQKVIPQPDQRSWGTILASLLPLWLLSLVIMVVGFPRPPISGEAAIASFVVAIAVSVVLLWNRWMTIELVLYSLFPFLLLSTFDEISTTYKTPFIMLCALILTVGVVVYQSSRLPRLSRGLVLSMPSSRRYDHPIAPTQFGLIKRRVRRMQYGFCC